MIRLENVSKRYEMGTVRVTALDNVSLEIGKGEFVVVLGPSGSGKTTLLNIVGVLDVPTDGVVHINGGNLSLTNRAERFKARREMVSFVFQTFNLFPNLTALENVQFVLDMARTLNSRERAIEVGLIRFSGGKTARDSGSSLSFSHAVEAITASSNGNGNHPKVSAATV